jgi:hypothetical protein
VTPDDRVAIIDPNHVRGDVHLDAAHLLTDVTARRDQVITGGLLRPVPRRRPWRSGPGPARGTLGGGPARTVGRGTAPASRAGGRARRRPGGRVAGQLTGRAAGCGGLSGPPTGSGRGASWAG